ncbi:MAG: hypothetical protein ACREBG_22560 [Pyrinomonadaceae bacterium]
MKRRYAEASFLALILLAIVALAAYPYIRSRHDSSAAISNAELKPVATPERRDAQYSKDVKGLRDKFNQDKGKVRLIFLLSPT